MKLSVLMDRFAKLSPRRQGLVKGYVDMAVLALEAAVEMAGSLDAYDRRKTLARVRLP